MRRLFTAILGCLVGLAAQPAAAKSISLDEADRLLGELQTPTANSCVGNGVVRLGGQKLLASCDAALAELGAKRAAERKPSSGRLGIYAIVEGGMELAHALANTKLHGELSPEACADFERRVRTLEAIDRSAIGEELAAMVGEDTQSGLKPLRQCRANATAPYVAPNQQQSVGAMLGDAVVLDLELRTDPQILPCLDAAKLDDKDQQALFKRCEVALGKLGYLRDKEPTLNATMRSVYLSVEGALLASEGVAFFDNNRFSPKTCELAEQAYGKLISVDTGSMDQRLWDKVYTWMEALHKALPICRRQFHSEGSPFAALGY